MLTPEDNKPTNLIRRTADERPPRDLSHYIFGKRLATADAPHQTIGKVVGLAVFASDALSSTAYATQEILVILAAAGTAAFGYVFPISIAIVILLSIVAISYEQTIHAYPDGGGAYIVARDNLGEFPALTAAAALLTDYILTVSVSIASGVAQITSAFPNLFNYRVIIAIVCVLFIMLINLRGVKESGAAFAIPTYFFIGMMYITVGIGLVRLLFGGLGTVVDPPDLQALSGVTAITPFLLLHAFSSGTAALTGVEAISNGITAFKEPRSHNAGATLIWMTGILGSLFLGISFLTSSIHAVPSEAETVISQISRTIFNGRDIPYYMIITATTVILIMAANTAFADFPRLSALAAKDGFLPRQLTYRGSRLVYSYGIATLTFIACILVIVFQASVTRLIPLYAIGVFMSFSLSQAGMARRWHKIGNMPEGVEIKERGSVLRYDPKWRFKMVVNGFGSVCTFIVMCVFAITKFEDGAWIVLVLLPILIALFTLIHRHYVKVAQSLSLENHREPPPYMARHRVIVPVSSVHQGVLAALRYAKTLSDDVTAVHISTEPAETEKMQEKWDRWGGTSRLVIVDSPYRLFLDPLLDYIEELLSVRQPQEIITIVVPHFIPSQPVYNALHMQTAEVLRKELLSKPGVVVTEVPYHI